MNTADLTEVQYPDYEVYLVRAHDPVSSEILFCPE